MCLFIVVSIFVFIIVFHIYLEMFLKFYGPYKLDNISPSPDKYQQQLRQLVLIDFALWQDPASQYNCQDKNLMKGKMDCAV